MSSLSPSTAAQTPASRLPNICERRRYRQALARGAELGAIAALHPAALPLLKLANVKTAAAFTELVQGAEFPGPVHAPCILVHQEGEMLEYRLVAMSKASMIDALEGGDRPQMCRVQLKGGTVVIIPRDTLIYFR